MAEQLSYRPRRIFIDRPTPGYVVKPWHKFINWGASRIIETGTNLVVNKVEAVRKAGNKLVTFQELENQDGIRIPTFSTDRSVATGWLRDGIGVVLRHSLNGHSGHGIELVVDKTGEVGQAPLYVQYVKKQKEFRVHVAFGEVIDVQEKRKRSDLPDGFTTNFQVRNHQTGWVYCRENIIEPQGMRAMAVATVSRLGLDFGAVDLIWNEKRNEVFVLECNTAPGLEGTTVQKYADAFVRTLKTS